MYAFYRSIGIVASREIPCRNLGRNAYLGTHIADLAWDHDEPTTC